MIGGGYGYFPRVGSGLGLVLGEDLLLVKVMMVEGPNGLDVRCKSSAMVLIRAEDASSLSSSGIMCGMMPGVEVEGLWRNFLRSLALRRWTSGGGLSSSSDSSSSLGIYVGAADYEGGSRGRGED